MQSTQENDDQSTSPAEVAAAGAAEEEAAEATPVKPSDTESQVVVDEDKVAAVPEPSQEMARVERIASAEQSEVPDLSMAAITDEDGELDADAFSKLVELYDESMKNLTEGDIVTGKVIGLTSDSVIVDVGYKSEGLIPREEFTDREGNLTIEVGQEVDVLLEKTEDVEGHVLLSRSKAERMRRWNEIDLEQA